jgi:hypothetical protein
MRSYLPSILYAVLVGPVILLQLFHRQDTPSILTGLMLILIPFFVWAICMIGRPFLLTRSGPALVGGYVPDPHVNWISIAKIVESMPLNWAADVREADPFLFKIHMVHRFIELALKKYTETNTDEKFHGILIDFADENVLHFTISSDEKVDARPYIVRSSELRSEQKNSAGHSYEPRAWFFDIISDYGTNAHRPVAFMVLIVLFNFLLVWINGPSVPNV